MPDPHFDTDVLIAGGGPVGMGLAAELGQRGVSCIVIERHENPQPVPKGQNLTQRTMEHFQAWGCEPALRAARTIPAAFGIGGMTAYRSLNSGYRYDWLKRELVRPFYNADNERLPQYRTEAVLRGRVAQLRSVDARYGCSVAGLSQDVEGVDIEVAHRASGASDRLRARYLVGADGARSTIRQAAGIEQTLYDHDRTMVLLVFRSNQLNDVLKRFPGKSFINILRPDLEGYWLFLGRVDTEGTFFFHAPVPKGADIETFDFAGYVQDAVGERFAMEIDHRGLWDCRVAIADTYVKDRIAVAGDAAHSHPPYGGYGINTGFEDARNLGWKLAAILQGWGGPDLFKSYDAERRPVFYSTAKDFIEKSIEVDRIFLSTFDPDADAAAFEDEWARRGSGAVAEVNSFQPNYRGSPIVAGTGDGAADAIGTHEFEARPGYHLAPARSADGENLFDRLGDGFTLLAFTSCSDVSNRFTEAARTASVPLSIVRVEPSEETERYGAEAVLVRPDHFVCWAGNWLEDSEARLVLMTSTGWGRASSGDKNVDNG